MIPGEHAGFQCSHSTEGRYFLSSCLLHKYVKLNGRHLFEAFIDFLAAFALISYDHLCKTSVDKRLLMLMGELLTDTIQVRIDRSGLL